MIKNYKTLTSGSSRGTLKTLIYGQYIHMDYNGRGGRTYLCIARNGQRGRTGTTKLTLQAADGTTRVVDASDSHYKTRRASIAEILAFKASAVPAPITVEPLPVNPEHLSWIESQEAIESAELH